MRAAQPPAEVSCATRLLFLLSLATRRRASPGMPPRRRGSSEFRGVCARPNGTYYSELRAGSFWLTLRIYDTSELATRAYDAATWQLGRPRRDLNFPGVASLAEAEFLVPLSRLVIDEDLRRHPTRSVASSSPSASSSSGVSRS
jgi:hypothetical protein